MGGGGADRDVAAVLAEVMDDIAGLFSLRYMRNDCVCNFLSSRARGAPLCPLIPAARKESCEVLCSGRKNQIKILNLSERVLINKVIYYPSVHKSEKGSGLFTGEQGAGLAAPPPARPPPPPEWANYSESAGSMGSTKLNCRVFSVSERGVTAHPF